MLERRLVCDADGFARDRVDGDVPETTARYSDLGREGIERAAVVGVSAAILEAAEVGIAHQANVAGLRALDHDNVVFIEVFALVYKFHLPLRTAGSGQSGR